MTNWVLKGHPRFAGRKGPLVLAVLDGVGVGAGDAADAVKLAATPMLDRLWAPGQSCTLRAHGTAVGLPSDDDMGNSEVGHNAMGCGRVYDQGALLVARAIASGSLFGGAMWHEVVASCRRNDAPLHYLGLLSDGNVHSHIDHLLAMLRRAAQDGVRRQLVHVLLDGRDVSTRSALGYIDALDRVLAEISAAPDREAAIASGGGRMLVTMDRYNADWSIVERGWNAHVHGQARPFASARQAVETFYAEDAARDDQTLPAFVVVRGDRPVGPIADGAAVVCFNFRGDRVIEISRAFDDDELTTFDRGRRPDVFYVGMMEYDGDLHIPRRYLVDPPDIDRTMGEYLVRNHIPQLAISETQKYGHVTYFWNGNRSGMFDAALEAYVEIASDRVLFSTRPEMKAAEITDRLIAELRTGRFRFARVNYANGDMVGHTGDLAATVRAVETVDAELARLARAVEDLDGILVVTADHGNADEMYQRDGAGAILRGADGRPMVKTSHTLNPVPFMIHDPRGAGAYEIDPARARGAGVANVTATCLELLGFVPPADVVPSLLRFR
jgi:2,3-bisphosphoglycerate-independent phosphoglycerate mutase